MTTWVVLLVPVLVLLVVLLLAFTGCESFGVAEPAPIKRVQSRAGTGTGSVTVSWTPATTAGSLLVALVAAPDRNDLIVAPSGWVSAVTETNQRAPRVELWYLANAPAGRSSETFTCTAQAGARPIMLDLREYSGAAAADVLVGTASNGDDQPRTALSTGPAGQVASIGLAVAGLATRGNEASQGAPTNGYASVSNQTAGQARLQGTEKLGSLSSSEQTGTTLDPARAWSAVIGVFKSAG